MFSHQVARGGIALAEAVRKLYNEGQTDYSLEPLIRVDSHGLPVGCVEEGDAVIFCCRRGEREIQLTDAFVDQEWNDYSGREKIIHKNNVDFVILTLYHEKFKDLPIAFAPRKINETLGEAISRAGLSQMRVAESEKFAHVTFFFNGGNNEPFVGEDDLRIPSPKNIPFEQIPELSLSQVTDQVIKGIRNHHNLIVTNFANGDVIGHTQNKNAKIKCAEIVDKNLGMVVNAALAEDYLIAITADHGNLEEMVNPDGTPHSAHTTNPVPFVLIDPRTPAVNNLRSGKLGDIAPTILNIFGIRQPEVMTGESLVPGYQWCDSQRVLLIILDGWGIGKMDESNPIYLAHTPLWDHFLEIYPHTMLQAAGSMVGLNQGKAGNSEAGHLNIGAGRIVLQDDVRLDQAMQDGSFFSNEVFLQTIDNIRRRKTNLHLIGLLSEKSSHGSIEYPLALLRMAKSKDVNQVFLHIIFDGRSTDLGSAPLMLENLERQLEEIDAGQIVTGIGRGIALDRDGNYARTKRAYDAFVYGVGKRFAAL